MEGRQHSLCVLELQDPDLTGVPRHSPALAAQAQTLISQCVASNKWKLVSGDIKTAFFSRDEEHHNIFIRPPDDVRDTLKLSRESIMRLRTAVYGLVDAPKKWWDRLKRSLLSHRVTFCALDLCAFVLHQTKHSWRCGWCSPDDLLGGGDEVFDRTILEGKREFVCLGCWNHEEQRERERERGRGSSSAAAHQVPFCSAILEATPQLGIAPRRSGGA